ncbi:MAG: DinB family protein [Bryobacterales bacterium]|nr:DinB family protein [Bryobacterales bacterium]
MAKRVTIGQIELQSLEVLARFRRLVDGLSDAQLLWRPAPSSWGIAECLQHLNVSQATYRRPMRVTFERERHNAPLAPDAFRMGFLATNFISMLEPPYRMKVRATATLLPPPELEPQNVIDEFARSREEFLEFAREASRVDMSSIRFANPLLSIMKYSLTEAFLVMLAHDRRHLWQAENVRNHAEFPST